MGHRLLICPLYSLPSSIWFSTLRRRVHTRLDNSANAARHRRRGDRMRRREFIALLGGAAAVWPLPAHSQPASSKMPVIGVLWHAASAEEEEVYLSVLVKAFSDLGYVEGKNIRL